MTQSAAPRSGPTATRPWWTRPLLVALVALVAVAVVGTVRGFGTHGQQDLYTAAIVAAGVVALVGAQQTSADDPWRRARWLLAAGVALSAAGDATYAVYTHLGHEPDVSLADLPWFAGYVGVGGAVLVLILRSEGATSGAALRFRLEAALDLATIVVASVLILWTVSVTGILADDSMDPWVRGVTAAYPVLDAVLLALLVRLLVSARAGTALVRLVVAGVVLWMAADVAYLVLPYDGWVGALMDSAWIVAPTLLALACWTPMHRNPVAGSRLGSVTRVTLAISPLLIPPVLDVLSDADGDGFLSAGLVGMVCLVAIAYARTLLLLRAEEEARTLLAASRQRYARLAEASSDAVLLLTPSGRIVEGRERAEALVGRSAAESAEENPEGVWTSLLETRDPDGLLTSFAHALHRPGESLTTQVEIGPEDHPRWLDVRLVNLCDDPAVQGIVVALSDCTLEKQAEQALQVAHDEAVAATRTKSAFLANMSHEIRTPMNGIIGLTELLRASSLEARQRDYVDGLHTAGQALLSLLNDVLDLSKIEAGALQLEDIDFSLVQVVEEVGQLASVAAEAKDLELLAYCSPLLPADVRGDPGRLRQVLLNLTFNAVKFSSEGDVVVSAHLVEQRAGVTEVRFEVTDQGIGIDPEQAEQLFAPFTQADVSTTRKYGGTGLGLAISRQLVEAMGGRIGVDSRPGRGSTFWVELPLAAAEHPVPTEPRSPELLQDLDVLVVDDNATNRMVLHDQLAAWGMRPTEAADAETALELLRAAAAAGSAYSVVLLDLCMPGVDGLDLARAVTADPLLPRTDMLLLSSGPDVDAATVRGAGVTASLGKPVRRAQLLDALLDLAARRTPAAPSVAAAPVTGRTHLGHVLVVEDNEINQIVAEGILESLGYTTVVAAHGLAALQLLAAQQFDAVLMDCQMPELDGYETTLALREREGPGRRTPVIAMTAGSGDDERERCAAAGMDDYVGKPFSPEELREVLQRWVPATRPTASD